jgi:hypothetical protein
MSSVGRNQIFLVVVNNSYDFPRGATLLVALEVETNAAEDISDAVEWGAERIISHSSILAELHVTRNLSDKKIEVLNRDLKNKKPEDEMGGGTRACCFSDHDMGPPQ